MTQGARLILRLSYICGEILASKNRALGGGEPWVFASGVF